MSRRETRSNGSDTKIDSALSHNLKGEVSREVKENEEGERTNTIIRMGRKASTYRSSEHPGECLREVT